MNDSIAHLLGPVINAVGIIAGGLCALALKRPLPLPFQMTLKLLLGAATVWFGLKLTWMNLNGSFGQIARELGIVLLAMVVGKWVGKILRLQDFSNSIGQYASRSLAAGSEKKQPGDGFLLATALFCAGPLAILASVQEGLNGFSPVFFVKAATDGLAVLAFYAVFGWSVALSALPVFAFEGTIIRCLRHLEPTLHNRPWPLLDSINATDGLLIFCVALIILEVKKIRVAEYLPSLIFAPLMTRWLW